MSAFVNHHHGAPASDPRPGREPRRCRRAALLPATRPVRTTAAIPSLVSAPVPAARAVRGWDAAAVPRRTVWPGNRDRCGHRDRRRHRK